MKISQREAHALKRRVKELGWEQNRQRYRWAADFPGGVLLGKLPRNSDWLTGRIDAARTLGHAVVVTQEDSTVSFHALPLSK